MLFKVSEEIFKGKFKSSRTIVLEEFLDGEEASYFLIVSDYIKWAKKNDIPVGPGRGSGAGSLVAWCLSCLLYTSPSPRDATLSRMPSSA